MVGERMKRWERVMTAVSLEKPDRVPVVPQLCKTAAAYFQGMTQAQVNLNEKWGLEAMLKTFDDFGGWDALYLDVPDTEAMQILFWRQPLRFKVPGRDLPEDALMQAYEEEVLKIEDYDRIIEEGWEKFYYEEYVYRITNYETGQVPKVMEELLSFANKATEEWAKRDVQPLVGSADPHPFFKLSLGRSMIRFTEDLYYRPEIVEKALKRMTDETISLLIDGCKKTGIKIALFAEERASGFYYPMKIFERFWWPYTVRIVDALWSAGIVTGMHLDTNWDKNIPYFKQLPRGSYILELDSVTDIFAAKEALRGHAIFHGDLPPAIQAIGSPRDVEEYCKKLIDKVGDDGGFILGVGCEVAPNCKPENFRALIETGKSYEFSKK
jgi:Uroporphyrinogen decarboxylase (URO-D)